MTTTPPRPEAPPRSTRFDGLASVLSSDPTSRRTTTWMIVGAVAAAVVVGFGLVWWGMTGSTTYATAPRDVPLIEAEGTPAKVRPENPGGLKIADRDKLVYQRLGDDGAPAPVERLLPPPETPQPPPRTAAPEPKTVSPAPEETASLPDAIAEVAPGFNPEPVPESAEPLPAESTPPAAPAPSAPAETVTAVAPPGGYRIQLASVRTESEATSEWLRLRRRHADLLGPLEPDISRVELGDRGIWYRVRSAAFGDETKAKAVCSALRDRKVDCLVVPPSG